MLLPKEMQTILNVVLPSKESGKYEGYNQSLTPDEVDFAESLLYELKRMNPIAHEKDKMI